MKLPRIGQHIKDKPCLKQRAGLGVFSSRFSLRIGMMQQCGYEHMKLKRMDWTSWDAFNMDSHWMI
jgi:hypothetical protein